MPVDASLGFPVEPFASIAHMPSYCRSDNRNRDRIH